MKHFIVALVMLGLGTAVAQNHDHHSEHTKKISEKKMLSDKKFKPTDDLKLRMEKILSLVKELGGKKNDSKAVAEYGQKISDTVNDIFKTCKLEPDADAAIHPPLGMILQGASELKNGKYDAGYMKIHEALLDYEKQFAHKGWKH